MKGLTPQMTQLSKTSTVSYSHCQALDHFLSTCSYFAHQLATGQEQAGMTYQRAKNDLFSLYYNLGWRNLPNVSWSIGPNAAVPNSHLGVFPQNNS